jgi:CheY-like chemotaxis protein
LPHKLLVIDDDAGIAKVVGMTAERLGLEFQTVLNPREAVARFTDYRPDIVILDMIMPGTDGIDVLHEILASGIPSKIILSSGYGDAYLRLAQGVAHFHDAGQLAVLPKPFRRHQLVDLLSGLMSGCQPALPDPR